MVCIPRPHVLACSLIPFRRSVFMFGAATADQSRPSSLKASHPERSTGRCRSTATRSAASTFIFSQMLRSSAAEEFNTAEMHSSSSTLWIFAVAVVAGFVVLGEACQLTLVLPLSLRLLTSVSVSASLIDRPALYCKYGSCRFVWCAGVVSMGNAAGEVPTEVSAANCKWVRLD